MKILFLYIIFVLIYYGNTFPQYLDSSTTKSFINSIINDSDDIVKFVLKEELDLSNRLGINYKGVPNKFLISNELDDTIKFKLRNKTYHFEHIINPLEDHYSLLTIIIPLINKKVEYYFYKTKLISKPYYLARN
jgi:hypothetical protein